MNPMDIPIPSDTRGASALYLLVNRRLNSLWMEYTCYVERNGSKVKTQMIFPILFGELDFYEVLLARIAGKLPPEIVRELQYEDTSDW